MIVFLKVCFRKAWLCIVIRKRRVCKLRTLARANPRVDRPRSTMLLALQAQRCRDGGHVHGFPGQMHEDPH